MTHASVFSGIGGPEVAATMLGWENLFHCEINPFGRRVLDYWYPQSKSYEDITRTDFTEWRGRVDVLTGGFPCQPFSYAGRRRGAEDDRYLWPSMYRAIDEIQPTWVVAENVAGILTMVEQGEVSKVAGSASLFDAFDDLRGRYELRETFTLQRICSDLESHGYAVQPVLVPACAVGAPHRRDRVFIVARRIASDTHDRADRRTAREDEGKGREERIQERHEVRKPDEPNQVRPTSEGNAPTDSACGREGTPRPSGEPESSRGYTHQQQSERRAATERLDRLHAVLRHVADTDNEGLERHGGQELQSHQGGQAADEHAACGSGRLAPHPDSHRGCEVDEHMESELADGAKPVSNGGQRNVADTVRLETERRDATDTENDGSRGETRSTGEATARPHGQSDEQHSVGCCFWHVGPDDPRFAENGIAGQQRWQNFPSVSPVHRGNDGLPFDVDRLTLSFGKWRTEALKAYGNAIVPQVMYEIFRAIEQVEKQMSNPI